MSPRDIACIVLAAGGSMRFGSRKQLQTLAGESLLHRAVRAAVECDAEIVVVVVGADANGVKASIADLTSIEIIVNKEWQSGLSTSIAAGITYLQNRKLDGILITLADQPLVDSSCLRRLLDKFDDNTRIVASEYHDAVGVPVVAGMEHAHDLMNLDGDRGAGPWLKQRLASVALVPMPEAGIDLDTREDLEKVKSLLENDV